MLPFVDFVFVINRGISYGLLTQDGQVGQWLLSGFAVVASIALMVWLARAAENRVMAARDFADDAKDAGDIGAGHGVTALYEYVPTVAADAPAGLKYQPRRSARPRASDDPPASPELLTVKLRFKEPAADVSVVRELPLIDGGGSFDSASDDLRFAAAVASFGMLLRDSAHAGTATLSQVAEVAGGALGDDPGGLRAEFLDLVRRAAGAAGGDRD